MLQPFQLLKKSFEKTLLYTHMNMLGTVAPVSSSPSVNDKDSLDMIKPFISVHKDLLSNSTKKDSIWDLNGFPTEFISIRKNPVLTKTGQRSDGAIAEKPIFVLIPGKLNTTWIQNEYQVFELTVTIRKSWYCSLLRRVH